MIYLVAPECRKWFLAQAKDIEELEEQERIQRLFDAGSGALVVPFNTDEYPPILFPSVKRISEKQAQAEIEHMAYELRKGRLLDCCLSAREAGGLWMMFAQGLCYEKEDGDEE